MIQTHQTRPSSGRVQQVSCEMLGGQSHEGINASALRMQRLIRQFGITESMVAVVATLAFGEVANV
jgi:hypothetical protein